MDIDAIIQQITEQVYEKLQDRGSISDSKLAAPKCKEKLLYVCMRTNSNIQQIKTACEQARAGQYDVICVPQWFVQYASELLGDSKVKVGTVIGLPGGLTSSPAKYAEVQQAIVNGASTIIIPLNMKLCKSGQYDAAKNDLAEAMVPCKGKAQVMALVEAGELDENQLANVGALCASCGIEYVMLSGILGGRVTEAAVRKIVAQGIQAGIYGDVSQAGARSSYQQAGASCFTVVCSS